MKTKSTSLSRPSVCSGPLVLLACGFFSAAPALAADRYFAPTLTATVSGDYSGASVWRDGTGTLTTAPTAADSVLINGFVVQDQTTVGFTAPATSAALFVFDQGILNLGGQTYSVTGQTAIQNAAQLTLNGGTLSTGVFITGTSGVVVSAGAALQVTSTNPSTFSVVLPSTSQLTVNGTFASAGGVMGIGVDSGLAVMTVSGAGATASAVHVQLGTDSGDVDTISGSGKLEINAGGSVITGLLSLGRTVGGSGELILDGATSTLNVTNPVAGSLRVGRDGTGTLTIQNGADLVTTSLEIGFSASAIGQVTVTGSGSTVTVSQAIGVGGSESASGGTGGLTVANGGSVSTTNTLKVWDAGTLALAGGTVTANGGFTFTNADVTGSGTINGNIVSSGTTYAPGASPGLLTITGSISLFSTDTLLIELAGSSTSLFDRFIVGGGVTLGDAAFSLSLLPGFELNAAANDTLVVIDNTSATPISGQFAGIDEGEVITVGDSVFTASYVGGTGNDFVLTVNQVPEPGTATFLLGGLALYGLCRRRGTTGSEFSG